MDDHTPADLWHAVRKYGGIRPAGRELGIPESTIRSRLKGYEPELPEHAFVPTPDDMPATHIGEEGVEVDDRWTGHQKEGGVRRYILTSAQNNVEVHEGFLANLEALASAVDAEILVSATLYDRTSYRGLVRKGETRQRSEVWWDKAIAPYMENNRVRLAKRLAFCGEFDILATTKNPLSSMESYCGRSSIIVPHNRFSFRCVESRTHQMPKEMMTTGSVTVRRFIQRKAGQLASFHHVLGALLVEVREDGHWHVHHLNAEEDGSFYWLNKRVANGKVTRNQEGISGLVLGDIHREKQDEEQTQLAYAIAQTLSPEHILVHDLIDFTSRNHHNRDNPFHAVRMKEQHATVTREMEDAGMFLHALHQASPKSALAVVSSNHHDALTKWIRETDWKADPTNARFYLLLAARMVDAVEADERDFDALEWSIEWAIGFDEPARRRIKFLQTDESYEVADVECGMHGHIGPSGTRGNPRAFSKLGFRTFTAHTHTPSIVDGCYTVGVTGSLNMGYNRGPSRWMHAHGIIYPNGKRAFLFVKNGLWRA